MPTSPPQPPKSSPSAPSSKKGSGKKSGRGASYKTVEFDRFVDKRIEKTRRVVKMADLFASFAVLLIGVISLLLVAAVAEHWLISGGFGTNERTGLWAIMLIGSGVYFARYIFPLLTHRVNKLYAADELERESPELKNSLVNLLQLREQGTPSPVIQQILEQQAAERLAVTEDHGVDLGPLLRVGYILTAVIALTGLYIVLSPKDFFTSAQRVILPWSEVAAPSRVAIEDLSPGDAVLSQGDRLPISLRIIGLEQDETAELIYTTSDGRVVEKRVSLSTEEGSVRYTTELPASQATLGLQSDLKYRIEAGDARTRDYQVEVLTTPTIAPQSIRYEYPEYTGFVNRTVEGGGDLRAIEGTRVTLMTEANMPIESAQIDFYADGRPDVRMKAEGQSATANFLMKRRGDSLGFSPEISNYVLRFTSTDGKTNRKPALYQREVIADLPPEARLLFPEEPVRSVKLDQSIEIAVEARDPDFALSGVWLRGEADGKQVLDEWLLKPRRRDKGHQGKYITSHWITPRKLGLVGGQTLDYWVEAADNREPSPNRNRSETQQLVIVADRDSGNPSEQGEGDQSDSGTPDGGQPQEGQNGEGQSGQNQPGQNESGQNESGENQSGEGESNQGSGEEGSAGNESSQQDGASEGEASENGASENGASESDQDPGGIQGKGEEDAQGDRQNGTDSGDGTPTDQQNDESSDSNPNYQAGGNKRDGPRDPNQEQGVDESNSPDSKGGEQVQTKDDSPVADDGSDDGAAFDKIREHLAKKRDATEEERNADDPNRQQQTGEQDQNKEQGQDAERPEAGDTKQGDPRDPTGEDPQRDPKQSPDESDQSENKSGKQSDSQSSESSNSAERGQDSKPNEGPRQGTGSSGQNQAADDGSGQSGDRGEGESSGRSGNQESSPDNQNNRPGEESTSEPSEGGRQGEASDSNDGKASSGDDKQGDGQKDSNGEGQRGTGSKASDGDADPDNKGNQDTEGNQPSSAGKDSQDNERDRESDLSDQKNNQQESRGGDPKGPSHSNGGKALDRPGTSEEGQEPGGDEANLDYARKQTDLVLDELSDQMDKQQIDQELLDELGWSEQDLQRFVNRWEERKRRAAQSPGQSESELDAALRSLGMSPEGQRLKSSPKTNQDTLRDLQQGKRTSIPPALRERLQRYNRGVSRDQSR